MTKRNGWALVGILFASLVLRPSVAAVGPLVPELQKSLALSAGELGLLTAIPVLCFGIGAFASPLIVRLLGLDRTLFALLALIIASAALRPWFGFPLLLLGTTVIGLAIAVANVILPSIVRERFPNRVALVTAAYTLLLSISASSAASTAVPLSEALGGWAQVLVLWVAPALIAMGVWVTQIGQKHVASPAEHHAAENRSVLRSKITWALVSFFGFQSLGFYALLSWLPSLLIAGGYTPNEAGGLLGLCTIVGVPTGIGLAANLGRFKSLSLAAALTSAVTLAGMILLLTPVQAVGAIVLGFGQAATFPISLNLISTRATSAVQTTTLSALSQGVGYILASAGTFVFGYLAELTGKWHVSVMFLVVITALQVFAGIIAGRNRKIENPVA